MEYPYVSEFPYRAEVRLLRWGESSSAGRTITLELPPDNGEAHPFRGLPTGHTHGQRFRMQFSIISDDEQPIPPAGSLNPSDRKDHPATAPSVERAGHLSTKAQPPAGGNSAKERRPWHTLPPQQRAGMLCSDVGFQKWVSEKAGWQCDEQDARDWLCMRLGIQSRAELATDPEAAALFDEIDRQFMRDSGRAVEVR